jgi:hypothetical protein
MLAWGSETPHLSPEAQAELLAAYPPNERDARSKGVPQLGAGAIYPVPEEDFVIAPIELPAWYRRAYGMDVGWNCTAAVWGAHDLDTDIVYIWSEYYRGMAEPIIHAEGIRSRGAWIPGFIDPASRGRGQTDGQQIFAQYIDPDSCNLKLAMADNKIGKGDEGGIYAVWTRLSTGKLKVFNTCQNLLREYRIYRRDEKGRIVKENDHAMDALRYLIYGGIQRGVPVPADQWSERHPELVGRSQHKYEYNFLDAMYDVKG